MFKRLGSILHSSGDYTVDFIKLVNSWENIVGNLAKHTSPLKLTKGTLVIISDHSAYASMTGLLGEELKKRITMNFPSFKNKITGIRFQINTDFFTRKQLVKPSILPHKQSPKYILTKRKGDKMFDFVEDLEIREKLVSLFIQIAKDSNGRI